jgi:hypothetical protein
MNTVIHLVVVMISLTKVQWDRRAKSSFKDAKHYSSSYETTETERCGLEHPWSLIVQLASALIKYTYQEG